MPELTAFDMLVQLRRPPMIVFGTAYDKYAVDAFEANGVDYLLKPNQPARLAKAIDKVEQRSPDRAKGVEEKLRLYRAKLAECIQSLGLE